MRDRWPLIQRGFFPETLPPCFTSVDLKRAYSGLIRDLKAKELREGRQTDYVRFSGTKHDGNRRYYGTPNPISYFYVASFIADHWPEFQARFTSSPFSVSQPKLGKPTDDRPIIVQSLSELTTVASKKLGRSAFLLKTDIAQFFPSIYTHAIAWSAHGIDNAKADRKRDSVANYFNKLDFFTHSCQLGETRGVLVGPDGFRLIAEFIAAGLDADFVANQANFIIGAARHVDDYYIGVRGEPEALAALSVLRDILQRYSLHINDAKTRVMPGIEPLNDVWAQALRKDAREITARFWSRNVNDIILFYDRALTQAKEVHSDSPVKIALRAFDQIKIYDSPLWDTMEPYLQRTMFHHPHCIDYVALIVAKRVARGRSVDNQGWKEAAYDLIHRHLLLNHHQEVVWLAWLLLVTKLEVTDQLVADLSKNNNAHIRALVVAAFTDGLITRRPPIKLGSKLATTDQHWLLNLVARARGYSNATFSGGLSAEFQHLAKKRVRLIDFKAHMKAMQETNVRAISRTRYGYDSDYDDEEPEDFDIDDF